MSNLTDMLSDGWNVSPSWTETSALEDKSYTFVMVPKYVHLWFFDEVYRSFKAPATERSWNCFYLGTIYPDAQEQADLIYNIITNPGDYNITTKIDGMAIAVLDETVTGKAIDFVTRQNISVITFDADAPKSSRLAFVGSNNTALGEELGKVLNQLRPQGGGYAMITSMSPNLKLRVEGVRRALQGTKWVEVYQPLDCKENITLSLEQMNQLGANPSVNGIVATAGWPMWNPDMDPFKQYARTYDANTTSVIADVSPIQMTLMTEGYVDGLVGHLAHQHGRECFDIFLNITEGKEPLQTSYHTAHFLEVLRVPLHLPPTLMDYNDIGGLAVLGYSSFATVALFSIALMFWTYVNRNSRTVRASQPVFMAMLCGGSLIMASAMIPLAMSDIKYSQKATDVACMSIPWLLTLGFCTIFSALFIKTWRIVRILENSVRFQRVKITAKDVLYPYLCLLVANIIILACWTAINPLVYERTNTLSRDGWNRVIATYGHCVSSNQDASGASVPYLASLAIVNGGLLLLANIIAYRARNISTEYGESKYIAVVMFSMLQAFMIGGPLLVFVLEQPLSYYVVIVLLDVAVSMTTLLFMFIPKILAHRDWLRKQESGQRSADSAPLSNTGDKTGKDGSKKGQRNDQSIVATSEDNGESEQKVACAIDIDTVSGMDGEGGLTCVCVLLKSSMKPSRAASLMPTSDKTGTDSKNGEEGLNIQRKDAFIADNKISRIDEGEKKVDGEEALNSKRKVSFKGDNITSSVDEGEGGSKMWQVINIDREKAGFQSNDMVEVDQPPSHQSSESIHKENETYVNVKPSLTCDSTLSNAAVMEEFITLFEGLPTKDRTALRLTMRLFEGLPEKDRNTLRSTIRLFEEYPEKGEMTMCSILLSQVAVDEDEDKKPCQNVPVSY